jgi:hypothetical protein
MVKFLSELQNLIVVLQVTKTLPWEQIQDSHIMRAKQAFIGDIMQVPPMFSAIKVVHPTPPIHWFKGFKCLGFFTVC